MKPKFFISCNNCDSSLEIKEKINDKEIIEKGWAKVKFISNELIFEFYLCEKCKNKFLYENYYNELYP